MLHNTSYNTDYKTYSEEIKFKYLSGEINVLPSPSVCSVPQARLKEIFNDVLESLTDEEKCIHNDIRISNELKRLRITQLSLIHNIKHYEETVVSNRAQLKDIEAQLKLLTCCEG